MADECLTEINERTSLTLTVNFLDEDGVAVVPDAATYRIDDRAVKTNILPATAIAPLSSSVELEITSDQNRIIKERSRSEIKTVTVEWDYDTSRHGTAEYRYRVMNLYGVVTVPSASVSPSASASPSV